MAADDHKRAGAHGTLGMLKLGKKAASADFAALDNLVGSEIEGPNGSRFRLVRLNKAAGLTAANAQKKVFKYSSASDTFDVEPVAATTDRPCGVGLSDQVALSDNDLFWVQVEGRCEVTLGDDTGDPAAGDYIDPDNDTDLGNIKTVTTTFTAGVTIGRCLEAASADGDTPMIQILHKLVG